MERDVGSKEMFAQENINTLVEHTGAPISIVSDGVRLGMKVFDSIEVQSRIKHENPEVNLVAILVLNMLMEASVDTRKEIVMLGLMAMSGKYNHLPQFIKYMAEGEE